MSESAVPGEAMPKKEGFRLWGRSSLLLITLTVLACFLGIQRLRGAPVKDKLHGDMEESSLALESELLKTPASRHVPILLQYLHDESPGLRYASVEALRGQHSPEVSLALEQMYLDSSSVVRQRVLEVISDIDPVRAHRLLLAGLRDEDSWVRDVAVNQMLDEFHQRGSFVDRRDVPMLMKTLNDDDTAVIVIGTSLLRKLTGKPWHYSVRDTEAGRRAVIASWKKWWQTAQAGWPTSAELSDVPPIRPTRTDPAPDFNLDALDGKPIRLADQKGRVTLLNFWGTWCGPCQAEIPDLVRLEKVNQGKPLDIIGIALGEESPDALQAWCHKHGVVYRQAMATPEIEAAFGNIHEVPVSVLIDAHGQIRYRWDGERDFGTFEAAVSRLLKE